MDDLEARVAEVRVAWVKLRNAEAEILRMRSYSRITESMRSDYNRAIRDASEAEQIVTRFMLPKP